MCLISVRVAALFEVLSTPVYTFSKGSIQEYEFYKSYIPKSIPISLLGMGITKHPEKDLFVGNMLYFNQINVFSSDMKTNDLTEASQHKCSAFLF